MIRRNLSPTWLLLPYTPRSQKQMAGCECSSHMSREERKKQSFHLYFAAVTPLRSTSRWCCVIHYNFRIMEIHCGSVSHSLLLTRSLLQHNPETVWMSGCILLQQFNTQDLNLICHMFTFCITNGQKDDQDNQTELSRVGEPIHDSLTSRRNREFLPATISPSFWTRTVNRLLPK